MTVVANLILGMPHTPTTNAFHNPLSTLVTTRCEPNTIALMLSVHHTVRMQAELAATTIPPANAVHVLQAGSAIAA